MKKLYGIVVGIVISAFVNIAIFSAPAIAQTIKWRMVTTWPSYSRIHQAPVRLAKNIYELSGGRLQITVHPAGELVSAQAVFDTVSKGAAEMGSDYPGYWAGKNSAFDLLGSYPMTLSMYDVMNWYIQGEGKAIYDYMYGKYNMVYFVNGMTPAASCIRSPKPIRSLADLKGKKIRIIGKAASYVLQKAGAVPVAAPPNEISQLLLSGAIDGAEFNTPSIDLSIGMADITKYNIAPGWNKPSSTGGIMINKDAWNSLPPDLKIIIEIAIAENNIFQATLFEMDHIDALKKFREKGTQVFKWSEKDLKQIEEWTWEYLVEEAAKNPDFDRVATSMFQYLKDFSEARDYEAPFGQGRNPKTFPKLPHLK
jgi:TRAP-type mannitol/chloroaromatic compound transport system substrate-binding protein